MHAKSWGPRSTLESYYVVRSNLMEETVAIPGKHLSFFEVRDPSFVGVPLNVLDASGFLSRMHCKLQFRAV
jgi:hypothetical protein